MSDEEIRDFLCLSPIYDRLSDSEKVTLLEEIKSRYFQLCESESISYKVKSAR